MVLAVMSALVRPLVEPQLPAGIEARFYTSVEEMLALAPEAEIGWFDLEDKAQMIEAIGRADKMHWLNSVYAGLDFLPLGELAERGVTITNGAGINTAAVADYTLLGMLAVAKDYRSVVRAQDRHEWLHDSPGKMEFEGARALLLGFGAIGQAIAARLAPFGVEVVPVRRSGAGGALRPDEWQARLGEFDWVILALPSTAETEHVIGAQELAAMKPSAVLVNIARGEVVDQDALVDALQQRSIAAALLDVTTPEPLPADHVLWSLPNAHITMHLSGRAQASMFRRAAQRFVENLHRYVAGEPVAPQLDPRRGY
ncbi:MAG: D-2-hydroxyacid dehydrogenase [Sphingomonadales bacterium]|nr:D-2-hydroxyacid dehydrogenase [Sphingomonadales bacterium]MBD3774741.1 D-2-hydroxyacid dehydrogenase [Paracoccaceae bacterium]